MLNLRKGLLTTTKRFLSTTPFSSSPVSALKPYFNRYHFIKSHTKYYDLKNYEVDAPQFYCKQDKNDKTRFNIAMKKSYGEYEGDPIVKMFEQMGVKNDMFFRVKHIEDKDCGVIYPSAGVPTHFMMFIRDFLEFKSTEKSFWLERCGPNASNMLVNFSPIMKPFTYDFTSDLDWPAGPVTGHSKGFLNPYFTKLEHTEETYDLNRQNEVYLATAYKLWHETPKDLKMDLVQKAYDGYTMNLNLFKMTVNDVKWYTPNGMKDATDPDNKAYQFMKFSKKLNSLPGGIRACFALEGGMDVYIDHTEGVASFFDSYVESLEKDNVYKGYRFSNGDLRGVRSYVANMFVPYWQALYLREAIRMFGVDVQ